jgi:hypothetical protein
MSDRLYIRPAVPADYPAVWRLAALDSATPPPAPLLVAEADGEVVVAVSLRDGRTIADPFRPTAEVITRMRTLVGPRHDPVPTRTPLFRRTLALRAALAGARR